MAMAKVSASEADPDVRRFLVPDAGFRLNADLMLVQPESSKCLDSSSQTTIRTFAHVWLSQTVAVSASLWETSCPLSSWERS